MAYKTQTKTRYKKINYNDSMARCIAVMLQFLPRCIVCRAVQSRERCPSIRLSVCLPNTWNATIRKKNLFRFLYHTKGHLAQFSEKKNGSLGRPLLPEILGKPASVGAKSPILSRRSQRLNRNTQRKKSSINTNRKSTARFPMSLR